MKPVRLGLIGLGHIVQTQHLPALAPLVDKGQVIFKAFCDIDDAVVKAQGGTYNPESIYNDHHEMFEKENLDAVFVCIPPTLHTDEILIAADRGISVFVEKPQSLDMSQAVRIDAAIQKSGIVSQVGFLSRYYPSAGEVHRILKGRKVRHALVQRFYAGKPLRYWTSRFELCGGSFVENTIHMVDLLRYFMGDIVSVSAFYVERAPGEGPEPMNIPHVYNVNLRFESGATANATASRTLTNVDYNRTGVVVVSDDSLIDWSAERVLENGKTVWESHERHLPFVLQAEAFIDAVQGEDPGMTLSPYSDGINSLAAVLGANASAERGGELIKLEDMVQGNAE